MKFKELRALQFTIGWENEIETCEKVERCIEELMKIYVDALREVQEDERIYVNNTITAVETCLRRECKVRPL